MVYVDPLFPAGWRYGPACHMVADSADELHAMAARLGLQRAWFQDRPGCPHYDLTTARRALAVRFGAVELTARVVKSVAPGVLFIPFHFYETAANLLTNPALDPEAKIPEYKVCAAKVEACE